MEARTEMLAKKTENNVVQCIACNRRCKITDGNAGYCGVRVNEGGNLKLSVYGKPCAVWADPIEKKPLFHFLPGTRSFSIGTFGCNFACEFCFTPDSTIVNDDSIKSLDEVFEDCTQRIERENGEIGFGGKRKTITASGRRKAIMKVFRHFYEGDVLTIRPRHAPPVTCTPSHRFFVYRNGSLEKVAAGTLTEGDYLIVPKLKVKGEEIVLDTKEILRKNISRIKKMRKLDGVGLTKLIKLKKSGKTSREIGKILGMHPVYLRKLLNNLKREGINENTFTYDNVIIEKGEKVKFKMEKKNGISRHIRIDEEFAELLGYYCAEGHTSPRKDRPSSFMVVFSYGKKEKNLVERTSKLLKKLFRVEAKTVHRRTTTTVEAGSSSLGVLLRELCGKKARHKRVPPQIARSSKAVITAFLKAFIAGDGCILKDNIAINTVSKKLAMGIYHLLLLTGYLPSFYEWKPPRKKNIEGRTVNQSTLYYVKLKAEKFRERFLGNTAYRPRKKSEGNLKFKETKDYWLVPIFRIQKKRYSGHVYNCEVGEEHSYLANFIGVCNCQNWDISQAPHEARVKDPKGWRMYFQNLIDRCRDLLPEEVVESAVNTGCKSISFTYNEPTIFSEYAIDTMELGKKKGLKGVYVTNGYETKECWDALKGYIHAANIDLKAYNQKFYTELCKVPNFEHVKESIEYAKKLGIWVEVTTLLIPNWNDNEKELKEEAEYLAGVDPEMPWHVTAFHPDYKMLSEKPTPPKALVKAREIGKAAGLKHVYCGNLPFAYSGYETTSCPKCGKEVVRRVGFSLAEVNVDKGRCKFCKQPIKGVWE